MNRAQRRHKQQPPRDYVVDYSWRMIFSAAGIILHRHGMSDDEIGAVIIEAQDLINSTVGAGGSAGDMIQQLENDTGIVLQRKGG